MSLFYIKSYSYLYMSGCIFLFYVQLEFHIQSKYYTITDFCRSECGFLLTFQVNKNSYSQIQKSVIVLLNTIMLYDVIQ